MAYEVLFEDADTRVRDVADDPQAEVLLGCSGYHQTWQQVQESTLKHLGDVIEGCSLILVSPDYARYEQKTGMPEEVAQKLADQVADMIKQRMIKYL